MKSVHRLLLAAILILPGLAWAEPPTQGPASADAAGTAAPAATPETAAKSAVPGRLPLQSEKDRVSYAIGVQTGRALRASDGSVVNLDALVQGLKDALDGQKPQLSERKLGDMIASFQREVSARMAASRAQGAIDNQKRADEFFAANGKKPGVVTLATGLQYRILKAGTGPLATEGDSVLVSYRGTLLNGSEFDSTPDGHPQRLNVAGLIAGWKAVLKLMPIGSHWEVFIPPKLAYGERGVGMDIGPNEALVFDLELLDASRSTADE